MSSGHGGGKDPIHPLVLGLLIFVGLLLLTIGGILFIMRAFLL